MRTFLHHRVADALLQCELAIRRGQPQWCFEIHGVTAEHAVGALADELVGWGRNLLFASFKVGDRFRTAVVDMAELRKIVADSVESGRVVSVMDGTSLGGCNFDFTDEGEGKVELLVTCWGAREALADRMLARYPGGQTFRGN